MRATGVAVAVVVAVLWGAILPSGCAAGSDDRERIVVSVASSLTETFEQIEADYETANPDVDISLNIAGSTTLVNQITEGAEVDVAAVADGVSADALTAFVDSRHQLAPNHLVVIHSSTIGPIESLDQLASSDLLISACDPSVPCGRLTETVLAAEAPDVAIDSAETNVRLVRERVTSGEADVGFVYATDAEGLDSAETSVIVAPIDLSNYTNTPEVLLLTEGTTAADVYDFVIEVAQ